MVITETQRLSAIVAMAAKSGMSTLEILQEELRLWREDPRRELMLVGERYYRNDTDIRDKTRDLPKRHNARLVHGFVRKLVDQKIGYLLAKPMSISTKQPAYAAAINDIVNSAYRRTLMSTGREAVNKGIAWQRPYIDDAGLLQFKRIPSEELIPLWIDAAHTQLQGMIRAYVIEEYEGKTKKDITHVEYTDTTGDYRYVEQNGALIPDVEAGEYAPHMLIGAKGYNWERVPYIAFKYNEQEQPLVSFIKALVDDYDLQRSVGADVLADIPLFTYILKGYGGQDLEEFVRNLRESNAISVEGDGGGVDKLTAELDTTAAEAHLTRSRKDIYEFGRGVDSQTEKLGSAPSGIALKFLYADLDMDSNTVETEFQASLEQVKWFIDTYFSITGKGDFFGEEVEWIFNRDIAINETDAITQCKESVGIISDETILANHPWVTDIEEEQKRLKAQREQVINDYPDLTGRAHAEGGEDGVNDDDS